MKFEHNFLTFDRQLAWKVTQDTLPEIKRTVEAVLEATPRAKTA